MTGRGRIAGIAIGVVVAAGLIGWVVGSQISSPAEVASRTAPPAAAPILVPAEERVISADIVTRGTGRFGSPQQLSLASSVLKTSPGIAARLPLPGTELHEGDILFITSGRPVFLLAGAEPAFRDLGPGLKGDDVRQLEEALVRLGFDPGPVDGVYDRQTEAAVSAWYQRAGIAPFEASAQQLATLRSLETDRNSAEIEVISAGDSVASAQNTLDSAHAAYDQAQGAWQASQSSLVLAVNVANANDQAAVAAVNSKQAALNALQAAGATPAEISAAEAELALARASAEATRLTGDHDVAAAEAAGSAAAAEVTKSLRDIRAAEAALGNASAALNVRQRQASSVASDLSIAKLQAGVQVPADELTVTIDEPDLGIKASGTISRVADSPGTNGVDSFHVYFEVVVDQSPPALVGASVRLTVPVQSTGGSVLAVPVSAVTLSADGSSRIQRNEGGKLAFVTVEPGLSADGFVAVKALDGALSAGDLVVVGFGQEGNAKQ
ncbi:MAG: hypothetical protein E6I09_02730 [Chloroflexi bacterium]|nr:MAG: hypothetical protein E6I09_02730 [Chloroflexota bacterium]